MGQWLDDLARVLASGSSRRSALRRVGAALLVATGGAGLPREAAAQRRGLCPDGRPVCGVGRGSACCNSATQECQAGRCIPKATPCAGQGDPCGVNAAGAPLCCPAAAPVCVRAGTATAGPVCRECGRNRPCRPGQVCNLRTATCHCPATQRRCGADGPTQICCPSGSCCGEVGTSPRCCPGDQVCRDQATAACGCRIGTLPCGQACCRGELVCSDAETSTCACPDDTTPCGSQACCSTTAETCLDASGPGRCGSCQSDPDVCPSGTVCGSEGACVGCGGLLGVCCASNTCDAGLECCGGTCTDTNIDSRNCGRCGTTCNPEAEFCIEGVCRPQSDGFPCPEVPFCAPIPDDCPNIVQTFFPFGDKMCPGCKLCSLLPPP